MDFSIWNRYRFAVDNFESKPVIGEPRNPAYYPIFFERYGFVRKFHWQSVLMNNDFMSDYVTKYISIFIKSTRLVFKLKFLFCFLHIESYFNQYYFPVQIWFPILVI